ncbi:MAG: 3-deoxy-7-phosphoheptulonate synthase, partial [Lachnospiraceae bacterium]|nr:3-deoxy-7-phosphoheptulonate synthase [Lachnospiraceae bacterium]
MIIIMKPGASKEAIHNVTCQIETRGLQVHLSEGREV